MIKVNSYYPGQVFGELALHYDPLFPYKVETRKATI